MSDKDYLETYASKIPGRVGPIPRDPLHEPLPLTQESDVEDNQSAEELRVEDV